MPAKKKAGFLLPEEVIRAIDAIREGASMGGKDKALVVTAALSMLWEAEEKYRREYLRRANAARGPGGSFAEMFPLEEARATKSQSRFPKTIKITAQADSKRPPKD
jgi:hypothetical protein